MVLQIGKNDINHLKNIRDEGSTATQTAYTASESEQKGYYVHVKYGFTALWALEQNGELLGGPGEYNPGDWTPIPQS